MGVPVRYVRKRPGELIHVNVKKLGRVPPGGGHRMLGPTARNHLALGHDHLHVAIDDATRLAFVGVHPAERAATTVRFVRDALAFFASHGVRVERVMTDNAMTYVNSLGLRDLFAERGIRHVRIRPRRPQDHWTRPRGSSKRSSESGPTDASFARMTSAWRRCLAGSPPTIGAVPTPGSLARRRYRSSSTRSAGTTTSPVGS